MRRKGFQEAIEQLIREELLDAQTVFGGIEIAKKIGAGLRLVEEVERKVDNRFEKRLENPVVGTALALGNNEGIVATTGFSLRGTSAPLLVRLVGGSLDLELGDGRCFSKIAPSMVES